MTIQAKAIQSSDLFKKYITHKDGLLATIQPLIALLAEQSFKENPKFSFHDILEAYIKPFIANSGTAIAFLDLQFNFIACSTHWEKWFSKQFEHKNAFKSFIGDNFLELFNPCPTEIVKFLSSNIKGKSQRSELLEYEVKSEKRWIRWESFPWFNREHKVCGIMIFCEDITEQQQIILHNKKLQQCNQMLENFAITFSHDLIQPMRQVGNFISLVESHIKKNHQQDAFVSYAFSAIRASLNQVRNLSEGIVLYCKKGDLTVHPEVVSIHQLIEQIKNSCLISSKAKLNIKITEDIKLFANKVCLTQLFQNLITNAVKFTPTDQPEITLDGYKLNDSSFQFTLHNFGHCPAKLMNENIFEPFQSSYTDGSGLGLIICKKIVEAYSGTIHIKSSVKKGTTVFFSLPLAKEA